MIAGRDLDPEHLARTVDEMSWTDITDVARSILSGLLLVTEAAGSQRREVTISRGAAGSMAPTRRPACHCGCPSLHDHWRSQLASALAGDHAAGGERRRTVRVIVQAAEALHQARVGAEPTGIRDAGRSGPERDNVICERWQGIPAERAAVLESARARSPISPAAVRSCRRRNGFGGELGEPQDPPEALVARAVTLMGAGLSDRKIAVELDVGDSSVSRWLKPYRATEAVAA